MSAIRGVDRRTTRSVNSSPYASARQASKKKSSWTFGIGGLLSYINPLRSRSSSGSDTEDPSDCEETDGQHTATMDTSTDIAMLSPNGSSPSTNSLTAQNVQNAVTSLAARGHQLTSNVKGIQRIPGQAQHNPDSIFSTPPRLVSNSPPLDANLSPAESLEKVQKFLQDKNGQALSEWETRGLLTFLEKSVQSDLEKPQPFRFSSSPLRTPARGNSPVFVFGTPDASANDRDSTTPRKTLSKNPNGVYRWQGGGSARPRNRYQSPSFGTRSEPPTIKLSPATKTDTKRRRVGDDTDTLSQRVPFPAVSPQKTVAASTASSGHAPTPTPSQANPFIFPPANGASVTPNGSSSSESKTNGVTVPRLRTSGLPTKPTAPSVPSPLRQTWGQSDSPPHAPKPNTPTKAASFMAELIKDVTPSKKPDVSNPYQTASPVKLPTRKPVAKRPRASAKPAPPPVNAPEPSPQAIIEATLPKGSKRSRPPLDFAMSTRGDTIPAPTFVPVPSSPSPWTQTQVLPSVNGPKSAFGVAHGTKPPPTVTEEVIDEEDGERLTKKQRTESAVTGEEIDDVNMLSTSKLSASIFSRATEDIGPDGDTDDADQLASPSNGVPLSPIGATPIKPTFSLKSSAPKEPSKLRFSYKGNASPPLPASVPTSTSSFFAPPPTPRFSHVQLPGVISTPFKSIDNADPRQAVIAMAVHDLPTYSFLQPVLRPEVDHIREAANAVPSSSLPNFDFSASFSGPHAERSTIFAPASSPPAAPTVKAFDWAAAGMQAPSAPGGTWVCSTCMLSNPTTTNKCTVCDTSR